MYTIKQFAELAGVSVRTLRYYDQIGLLNPTRDHDNNYREYGEEEALRLQQILFFRELGLPLARIKLILDEPGFDLVGALSAHRGQLEKKISRLFELCETIDQTIGKLQGDNQMGNDELYRGFSKEKQEDYEREVAEQYGTAALEESRRRIKDFSKQDWERIQGELRSIHEAIADHMPKGFDSPEVQEQIARHRRWLNNFYDCGDDMHLGLGNLYRTHPDFIENYKKFLHNEDGAEFMYQAIKYYCEQGSSG